jgi:hypothetical protein
MFGHLFKRKHVIIFGMFQRVAIHQPLRLFSEFFRLQQLQDSNYKKWVELAGFV